MLRSATTNLQTWRHSNLNRDCPRERGPIQNMHSTLLLWCPNTFPPRLCSLWCVWRLARKLQTGLWWQSFWRRIIVHCICSSRTRRSRFRRLIHGSLPLQGYTRLQTSVWLVSPNSLIMLMKASHWYYNPNKDKRHVWNINS